MRVTFWQAWGLMEGRVPRHVTEMPSRRRGHLPSRRPGAMRSRTKHLFSFALLTLAAILLTSQTPREGFAQKGAKGGFKFDPGQFFDRMSNGKDHLIIADLQRGKEQAEEF